MTDTQSGLIKEVLRRLTEGESLSRSEAREVMVAILAGEATPAQIGALLIALRLKGETVEEVTGFVEAMRASAVKVTCERSGLVDLCGTGGDGSCTINISTAASLVVAAAGVPVAKHGNRSASSQCGSADVLEALGVRIDLSPDRSSAALEHLGFAFLFAPNHHPAMRHAGGPRRELGVRTVFNILGPLSSPADVRRQLIGVYDDRVRRPLAEVLLALGSQHVWVVHCPPDHASGGAGIDELSITGPSLVTRLKDGAIDEFEVAPEDVGLSRADLASLKGGDAIHNAKRIECVLDGEKGPQRDAVLLNAGAALVVADATDQFRRGVELAAEVIDSGAASRLLRDLRKWQ